MKGKSTSQTNQPNTFITDLEKDDENIQSGEKETPMEKVMETTFQAAGETKSTLNPKMLSSAQYFKHHETDFYQTKEDFLAYIINDQTKFADFSKIDKYYQENIVDQIKKLNVQAKILADKEAKLKQLNDNIQKVLIYTEI